jgi:hypothetical protein
MAEREILADDKESSIRVRLRKDRCRLIADQSDGQADRVREAAQALMTACGRAENYVQRDCTAAYDAKVRQAAELALQAALTAQKAADALKAVTADQRNFIRHITA